MTVKPTEINKGTAYVLWGLGFFIPVCGIHRFYAGKPVSGTLYLLTCGFFYIGQFLDVFFIPNMVEKRNRDLLEKTKNEALVSLLTEPSYRSTPNFIKERTDKNPQDPMVKLLKVAAKNHNTLSLGQAMISLEMSQEKTEELLNQAMRQGLAHIDNDPESGAIRYHFDI